MSGLVIERLSVDSACLPELARWRHDAFLAGMGLTLADSMAQLRAIAASRSPHEVTLWASCAGQPAGLCMLVDAEIEPRHDCSPWLASLFVAPAWRGQGVGRALVGAIEAHAAAHGIARLHLYTDAAEPFYAACGWTVLDRFMEDGTACVLMGRDLAR